MDSRILPNGMLSLIKHATRALVLAAGGVAKVKAICQVSDSLVSKWQSDDHPEIITTSNVALIEFAIQDPAFTRQMAQLTGHLLTPSTEAQSRPGVLLQDLAILTSRTSSAIATFAEFLSDGELTLREERELQAELERLESATATIKRHIRAARVPE